MNDPIVPTERQRMFHEMVARYPEVGFGGARGGSKSFGGSHEGVRQNLIYPGNVGAIVRQDLADLKDTTLMVLRNNVLPPYQAQGLKVRWYGARNRPEMEIDFEDGRRSLIIFRPASDIEGLMSANLGWLFIDEASETAENFYLMVNAALGRCQLPDGSKPPGRLFWGSNPGPGWCQNFFPVGKVPAVQTTIQTDPKTGEKYEITRAFVPAAPKDNPHLPEGYEAKLRAIYPAEWVKRFVEGDWSAFIGQVFVEFDERKHVYDYPVDYRGMQHFLCMDWGWTNPAAALLISLDKEGTWWVRQEHRAKRWRVEQHVPRLEAMISVLDSPPVQLMDPAAQDQSDGVRVMDQFNRLHNFRFRAWSKRKTGPEGNILFFKQLLMAEPSRVRIHKSCRGLIGEIKEATWAENSVAAQAKGAPEPERMKDGNDHSIDALFGALEHYRRQPGTLDLEAALAASQDGVKHSYLTPEPEGGNVQLLRNRMAEQAAAAEGRTPMRSRGGWDSLLGDLF